MNEQGQKNVHRKRAHGFIHVALRILRATVLFLRDKLYADVALITQNTRLFLGIALVGLGALSFSSDRYCDGNTSTYYACTRPATYYYYPWWAITFVTLGSFLIVLWFLRKHTL
jgi:hypothetical protein